MTFSATKIAEIRQIYGVKAMRIKDNDQVAVPLPDNETRRLKALREYDILDTGDEQGYDDITFLASQICGVPIAAMTLVDESRQWIKSRIGLEGREGPRDDAFCAYTILHPGEMLVVPDATEDARFADNPTVLGDPSIRFYAGAPLVTPEGDALGALCVVDRVPRRLTDQQMAALRALSRQVMAQLELRRALGELKTHFSERRDYQTKLEVYQRKLEAANADLSIASRTDKLTQLSNRGNFDEVLSDEFERSRRRRFPLSVLLIDVDYFKQINDTFGHPTGDEILREVAKVIGDSVRPTDTAARYGGEEFAVVLPNAGEEEALVVAERIRRAIEHHPWVHRAVTVSVGAKTLGDEPDPYTLTASADAALYTAKITGRNRVMVSPQF